MAIKNEVSSSSSSSSLLLKASKNKIKLFLVVVGALANLTEVLFTSQIEYYCSTQLKKILLNNNNDDYSGSNDDYYYYYYDSNSSGNQCVQTCNNKAIEVPSKCYCQSQYCSVCSKCGGICFGKASCDTTTPYISNSPSPAPTPKQSDQCYVPVSPTAAPTTGSGSKHKTKKSAKIECIGDIDFTKRPIIVVIVFAIMDILKQYLYLCFVYARTKLRRLVYLFFHIISEFLEALFLFLSATWFCLQQCEEIPDKGGYKSIFAIFMVIASVQVACGPIREYFGQFEEPEIRLPNYLIVRKLTMTFISDVVVAIFSFNTHKVFATDWFRYLIFLYIWIVIAGIEMVVGLKEILFESFANKIVALRCHIYFIYCTFFTWSWFIWLLSFFTVPYIQACVSVTREHRELGEDCQYPNAYWLIVLTWINVCMFSLYFRYSITIINFVEESFRCTKGHKCKVINKEMLENITHGMAIGSSRQQRECNCCSRNVPLVGKGCCSFLKLHNYVFNYCKRCSYYCCMDCAIASRHSEYYLYGILWRKKGAPLENTAADNDDINEDKIIMRPSRRITLTPASLNPLGSLDLGTPYKTEETIKL